MQIDTELLERLRKAEAERDEALKERDNVEKQCAYWQHTANDFSLAMDKLRVLADHDEACEYNAGRTEAPDVKRCAACEYDDGITHKPEERKEGAS